MPFYGKKKKDNTFIHKRTSDRNVQELFRIIENLQTFCCQNSKD